MTIEVEDNLAAILKVLAEANGVSPDGYVQAILERALSFSADASSCDAPFKTGRGAFAKYGQAPSAEEIDSNRADMFRNFGENF